MLVAKIFYKSLNVEISIRNPPPPKPLFKTLFLNIPLFTVIVLASVKTVAKFATLSET